MDKNSIIGLSIIGLLIVGYSIYTQPSKEELAAAKHKQDSIAAIQQVAMATHDSIKAVQMPAQNVPDSSTAIPNDSVIASQERQQFGDFYQAAKGTEQILTLENSKIKVEVSSL